MVVRVVVHDARFMSMGVLPRKSMAAQRIGIPKTVCSTIKRRG